MNERSYIAIDLKSFYASVECVERGLDPLSARLVVADSDRTEKTICLAVSPALKAYGIPGRARLFEVEAKAKEKDISYIVAKPRMALYMEYSTRIYDIYLGFVAPEDIFAYSVDEVFIDATSYLKINNITPHEFARRMISEVLRNTGITATAGIGTNLYLAKVAMDIVAKHIKEDADGVRIAELDEKSYRTTLWDHSPITDFWRVGKGYASRLATKGIHTMGDIARCSIGSVDDYYNEDLLYDLFGVNAELLIDHAWGYEPCTISDIKAYKPENNSLTQGQVLQSPYDKEKGRIIVREMAELLSLDMVAKRLVCDQIALTVGYDIENLKDPSISSGYKGEIVSDYYGRRVPKSAHGSANLSSPGASTEEITAAALEIYDRTVNKNLLIRRLYIMAFHVVPEEKAGGFETYEQLDLFTYQDRENEEKSDEKEKRDREKKLQEAMIDIKSKYGKNAILKGTSLQEGATMKDRNRQIGGHKA